MKTTIRRVFSLLMLFAMVFTMCVPTWAIEEGPQNQNKTVTIVFNKNDGSENLTTTTQTIKFTNHNKTACLNANTFTRDNYEFEGWKDAAGISYSDKAEIISKYYRDGDTITLYAQWTKSSGGTTQSSTITFKIVNGTWNNLGTDAAVSNNNTTVTFTTTYWNSSKGYVYKCSLYGGTIEGFIQSIMGTNWANYITADSGYTLNGVIKQEWAIESGGLLGSTSTAYNQLSAIAKNPHNYDDHRDPSNGFNANTVYVLTLVKSSYNVTGAIDNGGTVTNSSQTVGNNSTSKAMVFTPAAGYKITGVTVNGVTTAFTLNADGTYIYPAQTITADIAVAVTTTEIPKLTVTYDGNGSDGGTVPTDSSSPYITGATITVLGNTGTLTKNGYTFTVWNTQANGEGTPYAAGETFVITADTKLYAQWTEASNITITYAAGTGGSVSPENEILAPATGVAQGSTATADSGYYFVNWTNAAGAVVGTTAKFTPAKVGGLNVAATYTAKFAENGSIIVTLKNAEFTYDGQEHLLNSASAGLKIEVDGTEITDPTNKEAIFNLIKINPTDAKLSLSNGRGTDAGTYTGSVTGNVTGKSVITYSGKQYSVTYVHGTLTINKRKITITSNNPSKQYDGNPLTNGGTPVTLTGDGFVGEEGVSPTFTGSQTDVGTSVNKFTYTPKENTKKDNYDITVEFGTLKVTNYTELVSISSSSDEKPYDGAPLTNPNGSISGNPLGITYELVTTGTQTNVGTSKNTIKSCKLLNKDGNNVTAYFTNIQYIEGDLKVTPAEVTVTADAKSKVYGDGDPALTATITGLVNNEPSTLISYTISRAAGENFGNYTITPTGDTTQGNYSVTYNPDELTINKREVTITGESATKNYTGEKYELTKYTVENLPNNEYTLSGMTYLASGTNPGEYKGVFHISSGDYKITYKGMDVTGNFTFTSVTGTLTITNSTITVTGESATVYYTGLTYMLTNYKVENLPDGYTLSGISYLASGKNPGVYKGVFTVNNLKITYKGDDVTNQFTVTYVPGTLTIKEGDSGSSFIPTISIKKVWNDNNNKAGVRPNYAQVKVYYAGKYIKTVTLSSVTDWMDTLSYVYTDINRFAFEEINTVDGYKASYRWNGTILTVTNTYTAPAVEPKPETPTLNKADHYAYIIGYPDGEVKPEGNITRAEAATIFFRLMSDESRNLYKTTVNSFSDVNEGDWYNTAISTLVNAGIITGYDDGSYDPNGFITRAELATMAVRFEPAADAAGASFTDIENHWASLYIQMAATLGWVNGYEDGTFKPDQYITRAETVALINRVLDRAVNADGLIADMVTWPDNSPTAWYYYDIQEATNSHTYVRTDVTVPAHSYLYERWVAILPNFDWTIYE